MQHLSIYDAVVVAINPTNTRWIKVKVPVLTGNAASNWAIPIDSGQEDPLIGDRVLVQFVSGDIAKPVYSVTIDARPW